MIEDNGYAISVPVEVQTAGWEYFAAAGEFPNLHVEECDGTEPLESYAALGAGGGTLPGAQGSGAGACACDRPYSHSLSDDERLYKGAAERDAEAQRDPVPKFGLFLVREGILDESEIEALEAEVDKRNSGGHRPGAGGGASGARIDLQVRVFAGRRSRRSARIRSHAEINRRRIRKRWWR